MSGRFPRLSNWNARPMKAKNTGAKIPSVTADVAERLARDLEYPSDRPAHEALSAREFQILCLLGGSRAVSEIARELSLSVKTVSTYRTRVLEKMCFKSNADITSYALRNGLMN